MTGEQPVVIRAQGRPDGVGLPVVGVPPQPGRSSSGVGVRWIEDGALLAVTTWGSSTHPTVPRTVGVRNGELTLTLGPRETEARTLPPGVVAAMSLDLGAYTTLLEPPTGLDPCSPTRVHVGEQVGELSAAAPLPPPVHLRPPARPADLSRFEGTPPWDTGEGTTPGAAGPQSGGLR